MNSPWATMAERESATRKGERWLRWFMPIVPITDRSTECAEVWVYEKPDPVGKRQAAPHLVGVIACQPRQNGSTPAGQAALLGFLLEIRQVSWLVLPTLPMPRCIRKTVRLSLRRSNGQRRHGPASGANRFVPAQRMGNSRHARQRFRVRARPVS